MFSHKSFVLLVTQIYAMPVFDMIETVLVMKFRFRPSLMLRLIARSFYVGNALYILLTELRMLSKF
jgi:hypothetical protein